MVFDPEIHHRRSIRLKGYDYSQDGAYFVTACLKDREKLFGKIVDGIMIPNLAGEMVRKWYFELEKKFKDIECDNYVIMPNHIHFITIKNHVGADLCVCPESKKNIPGKGEHIGSPLHKIIQWFKTMTTNKYIEGIDNQNWQPFNSKLWQRNYYEHIIRNERELDAFRKYINSNPLKWKEDEYFR